jgi:hypothetical protein
MPDPAFFALGVGELGDREYRDMLSADKGDPMRAAELLIPVSLRQRFVLDAKLDQELDVWAAAHRTGNSSFRQPDTIL